MSHEAERMLKNILINKNNSTKHWLGYTLQRFTRFYSFHEVISTLQNTRHMKASWVHSNKHTLRSQLQIKSMKTGIWFAYSKILSCLCLCYCLVIFTFPHTHTQKKSKTVQNGRKMSKHQSQHEVFNIIYPGLYHDYGVSTMTSDSVTA